MRIKINEYKEIEQLANKFKECHIEASLNNTYLVVDRIRWNKMADDNTKYITITVRRTTHTRMTQLGKMNESYDTLINRALDALEDKREANKKSKEA